MAVAPTPLTSHAQAAMGGLLDPKEMIRVRQLYLEKRHKQCVAACEDLLSLQVRTTILDISISANLDQLHPVHKAFLLFQQAISYEALALAAHSHSRNKIPFFEQAKEKFKAALEILPQPFTAAENGLHEAPRLSPSLPNFGSRILGLTENSQKSTSTPVIEEANDESSESASIYSEQSISNGSIAYSVPDFDRYSPRTDSPIARIGLPHTIAFPDIDEQDRHNMSSYDTVDAGVPRTITFSDIRQHNSKAFTASSSSSTATVGALDEAETPTKSSRLPTPSTYAVLCSISEGRDLDTAAVSCCGSDVTISPKHESPTRTKLSSKLPVPSPAKHLSRLSASLSSQSVLSPGMVPSPLFSRTKKQAAVPFPAPEVSIDALPNGGVFTKNNNRDASASVQRPPLPIIRAPQMSPVRKSAIQTLISRFESTLPAPSLLSPRTPLFPRTISMLHTPLSTYTDVSLPLSAFDTPYQALALKTPATQRFNLIANIFTSRSLARYNSALSGFRTSILSAIASSTEKIEEISELQERHAEEKRKTFLTSSGEAGKRMASYWLLSTPQPGPTRKVEGKSMASRDVMNGKNKRDGGEDISRNSEEAKKKRERIEKLRNEGWKVRKEKWGWKGAEHYDELRHAAERDLVGH